MISSINFMMPQLQYDVDSSLINLLSPEDTQELGRLREKISHAMESTTKHPGIAEFIRHMTAVYNFVARGNSQDPIRGMVCGCQFGDNFILVNTGRLKRLLCRSKSCMNGCFQRLGYDVLRPSHDIISLFHDLMPQVNPDCFCARQWCVRIATDSCKVSFPSTIPENLLASFEIKRIKRPPPKETKQLLPPISDLVTVESLLNRH